MATVMSPDSHLVHVLLVLTFIWTSCSAAGLRFHDLKQMLIVNRRPDSPQYDLTAVFQNGTRHSFQKMELAHNQRIGGWSCRYFFNPKSHPLVAYVSTCEKSGVVTVDGFITGQNEDNHLYYAHKTHTQQLVIQDTIRNKTEFRSLDLEKEIDVVFDRQLASKEDDVLSWHGPEFEEKLDQPMIELGVMMDKSFLQTFGHNDMEVAEVLVHHLVHGANTYNRLFSLVLRVKHVMLANKDFEDLAAKAHTIEEIYFASDSVYARFTTKNNLKHMEAGSGKVRGVPEVKGVDGTFALVAGVENMADVTFRKFGFRVKMTTFRKSTNGTKSLFSQAEAFAAKSNKHEMAFLVFGGSHTLAPNHSAFSHCSPQALAIIRLNPNPVRMGIRVIHAIGIQLGLQDEQMPDCGCRTSLGTCVMDENDSGRCFLWSNCSVNQLRGLDSSSCIRGTRHPGILFTLRVVVGMCILFSILVACCSLCRK